MTLTPEAEARIDRRIRRMSRRPGAAAARAELRDHVVQAAETRAGSNPATAAHVDAAFAGLGSDDDVRAAFFPDVRRRVPIDKITIFVVMAVAVLAATLAFVNEGGNARCEVVPGQPGGPSAHCKPGVRGDLPAVLLHSMPPLVVLAALKWTRPWIGIVVASPYALFLLTKAIDYTMDGEGGFLSLTLLAAGGIATLALAIRHLRRQRQVRDDAVPGAPAA